MYKVHIVICSGYHSPFHIRFCCCTLFDETALSKSVIIRQSVLWWRSNICLHYSDDVCWGILNPDVWIFTYVTHKIWKSLYKECNLTSHLVPLKVCDTRIQLHFIECIL